MFFAPRVAKAASRQWASFSYAHLRKDEQGMVASRRPCLRRLNFVHPLDAPSIFIEPDRQQEHSHLSNKNI
jgi:hypothetical protein